MGIGIDLEARRHLLDDRVTIELRAELLHAVRHDRRQRVAFPMHGEPPGIEIRIRDYGQQVDLAKIAGRDLGDIRPGGLGVHLIRAMMSSADYFHAPGGGLLLIMRKSLNHTGKSQE